MGPQLIDSMPGDILKDAFAARQQGNQYTSAVVAAAAAAHVAALLQAVDQLHSAVVLQRQALRQGADGGFFSLGQPANGEQKQVLLGLESRGQGYFVALAEKLPDAVSQFSQGPVLPGGDLRRHSSKYIVVRYTYQIDLSPLFPGDTL